MRDFAPGLAKRADAAGNFVRTGGRLGRRSEPARLLQSRNNYFRANYAYGDDVRAPGIECLLRHEGLVEGARDLYGMNIAVPAIVYANLLVPGQELGLHTDVPEFRGVGRKSVPLWLLVVMHHSGLFERWRIPIATAVVYVGNFDGGEFVWYPSGPTGCPEQHVPSHKTAILFDGDSYIHGVDRVKGDESALPSFSSGMRLVHMGEHRWNIERNIGDLNHVISTYHSDQLRYSVSWKAYCFPDVSALRIWKEHSDDLPLGSILPTLRAELERRGRVPEKGWALPEEELGKVLIDEFVPFPPVNPK